jgi:Fungal N-terminal domain of STAND proteins
MQIRWTSAGQGPTSRCTADSDVPKTSKRTTPFSTAACIGFSSIDAMAESIDIASGVLTLTTCALKSSVSLYQLINSLQSNKRVIRDRKEELEALDGVLKSLEDASANDVAGFSALKLPLRRCARACDEFQSLVRNCTLRSSGPTTSLRDWAKLTYMGDDITGFKNTLSGYKSTIAIALGAANMYVLFHGLSTAS